jgi:dihydrolipoamide dehydrogenase
MPASSHDERSFDVVVIGAGTAGLAAANAAHAEGARVGVVDRGPLGTFCARLGCMPSKVLLQSSQALARIRHAGAVGIVLGGEPTLSWPVVRARKDALVRDFVAQVVRATTSSTSFTLLRGEARFIDASSLAVDGRRIVAKRWIVATGSTPIRPAIPGLGDVGELAVTSDEVFDLQALPASVGVIGAGAVGVELGQFLARAGVDVDVLCRDDRLADLGAGPLRDALRDALTRELTLHMSARIEHVRRDARGVAVVLGNGDTIRVDRILLAAGRRPDVDGLGLSRGGVEVDDDGTPIHDEYLRTTNSSVFVAGDAAGAPAILHAATIQGRTAGQNATRSGPLARPPLTPELRVVFCDPIVATVGLDPDEAKRSGRPVCVVTRTWAEQGKARIMDETAGAAQLVVDRETRKLLGCQIVGPEADVLIHLASYAIHFGATVDDVLALQHYHPRLAEMLPSLAQKAVADLDGVECTRGDVAAVGAMQ